MKNSKIKTQYPGVRYRQHSERKYRHGQADRYFFIRYRINGAVKEEGLGWASEGWNAEKAHNILAALKANQKTGHGPRTLAEMRRAAEQARQTEAEAERRKEQEVLSLNDFFAHHYLPRARRDKSSWQDDLRRFNRRIGPALGPLPLAAISRAMVQDFLDGLSENGSAPATVRQYLAIIRRAYNLAGQTVVDGRPLFAGLNPAAGVRLPEIKNARSRFLTGPEVEALLTGAARIDQDLHDAAALSLNAGLRLGELERLTWPDIDFHSGFLTVRDEAGRKPGGTVPMNDTVRRLLAARKPQGVKGGPVFAKNHGGNFRDYISKTFRRLADELGLNEGLSPDDRQRRVVFHTLRHTFASWLALGGVDIYRIKDLMRHKTITMTMRYAHLIPDATREAVHNLAPPKDC